MVRLDRKRKLQTVIAVLFVTLVAYAKVTGPDAGYTNAPGDLGNCTSCHDHPGQINVGPGSVRIDGAPSIWQPGQNYTISVTAQQNGRQRFGFQLTALNADGNRAGTLGSLGGDTQVISQVGLGGRQYIEHTQAGTLGAFGNHTWQIRWTAPSTDAGTVRFFVAGNAADNDGTNQGNDYIYTNSAVSESPASNVTIALGSDPGGLTLQGGSNYTITWIGTGQVNVDSYEVRYSTDDGATFPISNLVFSTTNPNVTSFNWTVPNTPTTQARIRVQASTQSGSAVNAISGRFTISGGGVVLPQIFGASISGKKLFISGVNFGFGAELLMDGKKTKKTFNDDTNPTTMLVAKKAGKLIDRGQTVTLQVRNPDDSLSALFSYTRPLE